MNVRYQDLNTVGFIDPRFPHGSTFTITIADPSQIVLKAENGTSLTLEQVKYSEKFLQAGDEVEVRIIGGFFKAALVGELIEYRKQRAVAAELEKERIRELRNEERRKAVEFNSKLRDGLPFEWCVAIKDVLSGLSESSDGSGRNEATVIHVLVLSDFKSGRLSRKPGDYLCTGGDRGKQWSGQPIEVAVDGDGNEYHPKVTCKGCLRLADSIMGR